MNMFKYGVVAIAFVAVMIAPVASAETSASVSVIESLMAQIKELQAKLAELQGQVEAEIKAGLAEGMSDDDVEEIQEILSTDKTIYPEGLVTGYFGPLTREALKRFQQKFELEVTGTINDETREYLQELLKERFGDQVPPGLLIAPGIQKKVELRIEQDCDNSGPGKALFCQKIRIKFENDDDDDGDGVNDDDDEDDDNDGTKDEDEDEDDDEDDDDSNDDDEDDDEDDDSNDDENDDDEDDN